LVFNKLAKEARAWQELGKSFADVYCTYVTDNQHPFVEYLFTLENEVW
jgi:hypothetical protein